MLCQQENKCAICGEKLHGYANSGLYDADGSKVRNVGVKKCRICGTGVTLPQPSNEFLSKLYSKGVYEKEGGRGGGGVSAILDWLQRQRVREIEHYSKNHGRLLDVGCGKGRFVTIANRSGWDVLGQDFSCSQAGFATRRSGIRVWCGDLIDFQQDYDFDVITAWHVLEHTPDPAEMIKNIKSLTKKVVWL